MPAPRGLIQQIDQHLHRTMLLPRGARLLVGVSGGADSVALLKILEAINRSDYWHWTLVVGHVDHGIRGQASKADARFVAQLAARMDLPLAHAALRLGARTSEDAARQARLRACARLTRRFNCAAVVLAHHADDQAETVLMRLFRGTGIDGLSAMTGESDIAGLRLVRPLLETRRAALRAYLQQSGQTWREDQTNRSPQYTRNRLRAEIMPAIEAIWPQAVPAICRLAATAAEHHAVVAAQAAVLLPDYAHRMPLRASRAALRAAAPAVAMEAFRRLAQAAGASLDALSFERLREAMHLVRGGDGGKRIELGGGLLLTTRGDQITLARLAKRRGPR